MTPPSPSAVIRLSLGLAVLLAAVAGCRRGEGTDERGGAAPAGARWTRAEAPLANGQADALRWGLHVGGALLAGRSWSSGTRESGAPAARVARNLEQLAAWRMNLLVVDGADRTRASLLLPSRVLSGLGWSAPPRAIAAWVQQAHRRQLPVYLDMTPLGRSGVEGASALTPVQVGQATTELLRAGGFDGVVFSGPLAVWAAASQGAARAQGRRFVAGFGAGSERADALLATIDADALPGPGSAAGPAAARPARASVGQRIVAELGMVALVAGQARATGRRLWVEVGATGQRAGLRHNLLLLAAAQHGATGYLWRGRALGDLPWRDDDLRGEAEATVQDLEWLRRPLRDRRPRAALVLALPTEEPLHAAALAFLRRALGPVVHGLALAGYELRAAGPLPPADADAYVVLASGRLAEGAPDLSPLVVELLRGPKPVVLLVDGVSDAGAWRQALPLVGLRPGWPQIELQGSIERIELADPAWPGGSAATGEVALRAALIPERAVSGQLLASVTVQGARTPLLVGSGNKLLLNASAVPAAAAFWMHRLLGGGARLSFDGAGFTGRRSAFLSFGDTQLEVDLPLAPGTELRVLRYGADGQRQPIELWPYEPPLKTVLAQHELLVVEGADP